MVIAGGAGGAGGGAEASRSAAKGCESLCWFHVEDCKRCDVNTRAALASDVILGVLDTAALPKTA